MTLFITVNARISAQLQIIATLGISAPRLLRLKIWNKRTLQMSPPPPSPLEKTRFSTQYDIRDVKGTFNECDIRNSTKLIFFKVVRVASHLLDRRNIHVSTKVLHFIKFLVKLCSQTPASLFLP